jgi:hypothetical protein
MGPLRGFDIRPQSGKRQHGPQTSPPGALPAIAKGAGFPYAAAVDDPVAAEKSIVEFLAPPELAFLAVGIDQEDSPYPPAPALSQVEERTLFMRRLAELDD